MSRNVLLKACLVIILSALAILPLQAAVPTGLYPNDSQCGGLVTGNILSSAVVGDHLVARIQVTNSKRFWMYIQPGVIAAPSSIAPLSGTMAAEFGLIAPQGTAIYDVKLYQNQTPIRIALDATTEQGYSTYLLDAAGVAFQVLDVAGLPTAKPESIARFYDALKSLGPLSAAQEAMASKQPWRASTALLGLADADWIGQFAEIAHNVYLDSGQDVSPGDIEDLVASALDLGAIWDVMLSLYDTLSLPWTVPAGDIIFQPIGGVTDVDPFVVAKITASRTSGEGDVPILL